MSKKKTVSLVIFAIILLAGFITSWKNMNYSDGFESIGKGMTEEQVTDAMGKSDLRRLGCRDTPTWQGDKIQEDHCGFELQYNAFLLPKFWTIGFGKDGAVISKYEYVSP
ncbi:hypothetical protein E8F20_00105 [Pseudomonas sp. BN415]|uniref:hypothetical protein n=1 Tax=Pseudomonas sp. BN415 TaxID=2567889 RepID=UPI002458818F|nr:hypothetical protein [Pseudomonas sp. BN415]MDH4580271.1 hypothetical protein [Pseudomonas sp. BN415]